MGGIKINVDNDIKIREFKESDLNEVTQILFHSFKSKFASLTNLSDESNIQLLIDAGFVDDEPFEGYLVAEKIL